ncbi:hypothetical protein AB0J72_02195 [Dactylosporangium sp. NPDC049742]|uniref:TolB family protein n=1 Tax=Dactylosporangium sp. NPDC049742 TaxID=3154737 RepID=UPI003438396A
MHKHTVKAACVAAAALTVLTGCAAGAGTTTPGAATSASPAASAATTPTATAAPRPTRTAGISTVRYYKPAPGGKYSLQRLSGDKVVGLMSSDVAYAAAVSPDGSKIAFVTESELRLIGTDGTGARSFGTGYAGVGFEPAWSSTGDRLLVSKRDAGVGTVDIATGAFTPLRHDLDGTRLALDVIHPGEEYGDIGPNLKADAIVDTTSGKTVAIPVTGTITQILFGPDGSVLVRSTRQAGTTLTLLNADLTVRTSVQEPAVAKNWRLTGYS